MLFSFFSLGAYWRNRDVSSSLSIPLSKRVLFFVVSVFVMNACSDQNEGSDNDKNETAVEHAVKHLQENYVCPMHPQIVKDHPDNCPLCGMALVKKKISRNKENAPVVELSAAVIQKLGVKTAKAEKGRLWRYIKTVGQVAYDENKIEVIEAQSDGWVENLGVRRAGLSVTKGQLLMELYSPDFLKAQKEFIREQKKDHSGILKKYAQRQESVDARDRLRYLGATESMINEISRTGKPMFRIPVYSHQYGNVVRHKVKKHQYIEEGDELFTIADLSAVWVIADVYEQQIGWIKRRQSARVSVKALPGKKWDGQVIYIEPELDPVTRTLQVRVRVPNYDGELRPNMVAEVEIFAGPEENVIKVPQQAVIQTGERESVVLHRGDGRFQPADITTGVRAQGMVQVLSGLSEGDEVVVSGQFLIDSEANLQASFSRFADEK